MSEKENMETVQKPDNSVRRFFSALRAGCILKLFAVFMAGVALTSLYVWAQNPIGLEQERISPSPEARLPAGVRPDLPQPTDENGTRDVFLLLDGYVLGRVAHLRIPAEYVSMIGRPVDRYAKSMSISMLWPSLASTNSPEWKAEFERNGHRLPKNQISIQIHPNNFANVVYWPSRILGEMHRAKIVSPHIKYKDIDPVTGFDQGIRKENYGDPPDYADKGNAITDYYIDWFLGEQPNRVMICHPYYPVPWCSLEMFDTEVKTQINVSITFPYHLLPVLPKIIETMHKKVDGFVVKIYPPNSH